MQNKIKKVAILVGGPSLEYEVSLESGENVLNNLLQDKYAGQKILIDQNGNWEVSPEVISKNFSLAFIAMHGKYGEDGTVQRILEEHKIPYTGSSPTVSALAMNKFLSLRVFKSAGLNVPFTILLHKTHWQKNAEYILKNIFLQIKKPWVIKPNNSGSSLGVKIVSQEEELKEHLNFLFQEFNEVLVQEFILGKEVTCGVVDFGHYSSAFPLLPTEIIPLQRDFFDFQAKYDPNYHLEITPARLPWPYLQEIRKIALFVHRLIQARHFSRTDMIIGQDKKIYVLEINTIPGLTKNSLLPQEAEKFNLPFAQLLDMILKSVG